MHEYVVSEGGVIRVGVEGRRVSGGGGGGPNLEQGVTGRVGGGECELVDHRTLHYYSYSNYFFIQLRNSHSFVVL